MRIQKGHTSTVGKIDIQAAVAAAAVQWWRLVEVHPVAQPGSTRVIRSAARLSFFWVNYGRVTQPAPLMRAEIAAECTAMQQYYR